MQTLSREQCKGKNSIQAGTQKQVSLEKFEDFDTPKIPITMQISNAVQILTRLTKPPHTDGKICSTASIELFTSVFIILYNMSSFEQKIMKYIKSQNWNNLFTFYKKSP